MYVCMTLAIYNFKSSIRINQNKLNELNPIEPIRSKYTELFLLSLTTFIWQTLHSAPFKLVFFL